MHLPNHSRWLDWSLIARVLIQLQTLTTISLALFTPMSLTWILIQMTGVVGSVIFVLFVFCALCGLADLFVNDILPPRFRLPWVKRNRWLIISAIGVVYLFLGFATSITVEDAPVGYLVLPFFYLALGLVALWWSAADVAHFHAAAKKKECEHDLA